MSLLSTSLLLAIVMQQPPAVQRPTAPATARPTASTPAATPRRAGARRPHAPHPPHPSPAPAPAPAPVDRRPAPPTCPGARHIARVPAPAPLPTPEVGPPFYTPADMQAMRQRHGLEAAPPTVERKPVFRCWVADPTCGFVVELNATSAYAFRARQGSVNEANDIKRWNSARVQYDVWF